MRHHLAPLALAAVLAAGLPAAPPTIAVTEDPAADRWAVEVRADRALKAIRFRRNRNRIRARKWAVETPGWAWRPGGGPEVLEGPPAETVRFSFATDPARLEKDYELHVRFADGGRLLYAGHLAAALDACTDATCTATTPLAAAPAWRFETAPGRRVSTAGAAPDPAAPGHVLARPATDPAPDFVYFGPGEPVAAAGMRVVVDGGMPPWLRDLSATAMPAVIAEYSRLLGTRLADEPVAYLSYDAAGNGAGGGVVGHSLQVTAFGPGWVEDTPLGRNKWTALLAHEAFHLFNGGAALSTRGGATGEWLSESSAVFFAVRAMEATGAITARQGHERLVHAANRCAAEIDGRAILDTRTPADSARYYDCGAALLAVTDGRLLAASGGRRDLGDLFAGLLKTAREAPDRAYDTWDFLRAVQDLTGDPLATGDLGRFLHQGLGRDTRDFLVRGYRAAGIPVETDDSIRLGADATPPD